MKRTSSLTGIWAMAASEQTTATKSAGQGPLYLTDLGIVDRIGRVVVPWTLVPDSFKGEQEESPAPAPTDSLRDRLIEASKMQDYNAGNGQWLSDLLAEAAASIPSASTNTPGEKWPDDFPKVEGRTEFGTYYVTVRPHTDEALEKCVQTQCAVSLDYGPNRLLLGFEVFDIPEEK